MTDPAITDVMRGVPRLDDTPPLGLPLPATHRKQRRQLPRPVWVVLLGIPVGAAALGAGLVWGAPSGRTPAAVASSPSPSDSPAAVSPAPLPSTADAPSTRLPATHTAPGPSPTRKATRSSSPRPTASPSPTHTRKASPAPSPTSTDEKPSPGPTDTDAPPTLLPPTITPEATDGH